MSNKLIILPISFVPHSKKCWVVLTQNWLKYGQTNVGLKM